MKKPKDNTDLEQIMRRIISKIQKARRTEVSKEISILESKFNIRLGLKLDLRKEMWAENGPRRRAQNKKTAKSNVTLHVNNLSTGEIWQAQADEIAQELGMSRATLVQKLNKNNNSATFTIENGYIEELIKVSKK